MSPMSPTLTDVARHAEVALSTASRAFSDPGRLRPETLRKVLAAAQELGYRPAAPRASEASAGRADTTVAVVVPDIANPVFGAFVKAAQNARVPQRQTVVLADTDFDPDRERALLTRLRDQADGLVVCSPRLPADEVLTLCGRTPAVLVNRETTGTDCVLAEAEDGLRQAVEHLAALGHRRLAHVPGTRHSWSSARRAELVRAQAARVGLEVELLGRQSETVAGGTAAAAGVIASGASAVITHNDLMALGVITGARALGVRVPEELSVVGIDDIPFAAVAHPALTSIAVPMDRAGTLSVDLLARAVAGDRQTPRVLRLPTQLVVRGSTGPAPAGSAQRSAKHTATRTAKHPEKHPGKHTEKHTEEPV
ncbi:LacI family DNA-binding transcriptional regulator [Streptomyces sclerotialus]|uniref:LacI family DNA-binding transcriptional regulator n=1 Tax=Streptomyces sclerotialus TaxID=1957 RepID=UPI000A838FAF